MEETPGPRERLLRSARRLTYAKGVGVGVDAILQDAGVARRSLYQHFGGKDGLIAEVLHSSASWDQRNYVAAFDAGGDDPRGRIMAFFDTLATMVAREGYRGCRYLSADLALPDPDHPAHAATQEYRHWRHQLFHDELERLDHPDPSTGAQQLTLLVDGVLVVAATQPGACARPAVAPTIRQRPGSGRRVRRPPITRPSRLG